MKVLFIGHYLSEKSNRAILEEISKIDGVKLSAITVDWYSKGEKFKKTNYTLFKERSIFRPHIYRYFFVSLVFLKVLKMKPDIIFADQEPGCVSTLQSLLWAKLSGAKFCFRSYENIYMNKRFPISLVESIVLKNSDFAMTGNEVVTRVLQKKGFKKKIFIAELGLSEENFRKKNVSALKKKLGVKNFAIAYFGRLNPEKSIETLIEASALLNFKHQLVLDTFFADKKYLEKLILLAKKKGVFNKIVFVNPKHEEMPDYYNAVDLVVIPSKSTSRWKEQFGRTIIEAMACQTPVVGSDSGSIPRVIGNAGLVFTQKDENDLAKKIIEIYKNTVLRKKIIKAGVKRVKNNFTWDKIAKKMFEAFKQKAGKNK